MELKKVIIILCVLLLVGASERARGQAQSDIRKLDLARVQDTENLNVFQQWIRWNNGGSLLINHLIAQAFELYAARDMEIAELKTQEDWMARQKDVKQKLMDIVGPFPDKTPLQPAVTGIIKKPGYRIEKIIFESMPGFYVTGCLYVPEKIKGKVPAVLNLIGHEQESFRAVLDQVMATNLVKKGFVVFTIDPLGQGEHVQYYDPKVNFSSVGYSVVEHCYFGNQCFLSGVSSARYFIWDGIRAIDYLVTRKEVDAARIGVTGFSGGGTVTSYLGALDERVKVAIPSSWSTAARRQLETKGAQDAEATLIHSIKNGITYEDLVEVRAPKPTLMTFTSRDEYLSMQGAREAFREASRAFEAFGQGDNLQWIEDDAKHWLTPKIREGIYGFFMKHLGVKGDVTESEVEIIPQSDLFVTKTGQISTSLGGDMVFDVHQRETQILVEKLLQSRKNIAKHNASIPETAKRISGYKTPEKPVKEPFINGRYQREGYTVGKYAIEGEGNYVIPMLLFVPDGATEKNPALIYLHPKGKVTEAKPGGDLESLVKQGFIVAAIDVIGVGETENTASRGLADGYMGVLIGRSVVGIQAADIVNVLKYLKTHPQVDPGRIGAVAIDGMCLPLIHAAAFEPDIKGITLIGCLVSYRTVAMNRQYRIGVTPNEGGGHIHPYEVDFSWGISKVLTGYDLPDLLGSIAPRKVALINTKDHMNEPASEELLQLELIFPRSAYSLHGASSNLRVQQAVDKHGVIRDVTRWTVE